jgi:sarcosine oxidase delta subunit
VEGCRQWLVLERDTATNTVGRSWLARSRATQTEQSHGPA